MRPAIVSEQAIRAAIRELAADGHKVTGVAVRELLRNRFGACGGVERVYRLLQECQAENRSPAPAPSSPIPNVSDESREAAIARADLAEHRERMHQERWAREIDQLRARVATSEDLAHDLREARQRIADLTRALASAQLRIAQLERSPDEPG
jgi:hypothetical protein